MNKNKLLKKDYPTKRYFHFDYPEDISSVESYVQNPKRIAEHSFFPLIAYKQRNEKYTSDPPEYTYGRPYKDKPRPIKYAGHLDGYIYKYYAKILNEAYNEWTDDAGIDDSSTAYRTNKKGKSNIDFAAEVINYIGKTKEAFVLVGDFKKYFDSLNHQLLKKQMYRVLSMKHLPNDWYNIFKSVTNHGFVEKDKVEEFFEDESFLRHQGYKKFTTEEKSFSDFRKEYAIESNKKSEKGIPQGVPISAVMANVYAIDFDQDINNMVKEHDGIYRRYSDDFIIVIPIKENKTERTQDQFRKIIKKVRQTTLENKLKLSEDKTHIYKKNE